MQSPLIHILWDASHIWGLMAWRSLKAQGLRCRLTKAEEIARGILRGTDRGLLLVPGGNARRKTMALGTPGLEAIRTAVGKGWQYLGICGGAGLALSLGGNEPSLTLCPWSRMPCTDRLQHLISGHVIARMAETDLCPPALSGKTVSLPVWWPGRFLPKKSGGVTVLATAVRNDADFWLGDLPLASIPDRIISLWREEYGLDLSSGFLHEMPLVLAGSYGAGGYVVSYSHIETPESPDANQWLAHILKKLGGAAPLEGNIPAWAVGSPERRWPESPDYEPVGKALESVESLVRLGIGHALLSERTSWLLGWRSGVPGAQINNLRSALSTLVELSPGKTAGEYWRLHRENFIKVLDLFTESAEENLLTRRITAVLGEILPHTVRSRDRRERQEAIFGCPRRGGGLLGALLEDTEEMIFRSQENL